MVLATAKSKSRVLIRLTDERWQHIITTHLEVNPDDFSTVMEVISNPDFILKGGRGELLAVKKISGKKIWIVVPYKEISQQDGFVVTAYKTTDVHWLLQREVLWSKES